MRYVAIYGLVAMLLAACGKGGSDPLFVDQNGFVLNRGDKPSQLNVGIGMTAERLLQLNPSLKGAAWIPSQDEKLFDELRLSIQSESDLQYNDGILNFSTCVHSISIDGDKDFKVGVASIGFKVCNPPVDDPDKVIEQASKLIDILDKSKAKNFSHFYRTATQSELIRVGGDLWSKLATQTFPSNPPPRDDPEHWDYLMSVEQARAKLLSKKVNGIAKRLYDGRVDGGSALVGVYATDRAIIEVGIWSNGTFGGENLTVEQQNSIRYFTGMSIRRRP